MIIAARAIEGLVGVLTIVSTLFAVWMLVGLLRLRRAEVGTMYRGGVGQWTWATHRITGVLILAFLFGHIVDTFTVGFGPELYDETIALYKQWWFKPFEVGLIAAVLYHGLNGLRILLFDFWPKLARFQRPFAYVGIALFVIGFVPAAYIMMKSAIEESPFLK